MGRRCAKILDNGKRCKVAALKGQKYCLFHSTKQQSGGGGKPFRSRSKVKSKSYRRRN